MPHSVPLVCVAGELSLGLGTLPALEQHRAEAAAEPAWGTGRPQSPSEGPGEGQGDTVSASTPGRADSGKVDTELELISPSGCK